MSPEEIKSIVETVVSNKIKYFWLYIIVSVLLGFASAFLIEYFKEKGKNLATKSDLQDLTNKVESIRYDYIKKYKLEETLLNNRIQIYKLSTSLKEIILRRKNNLGNEKDLMESIFNQLRELLVQLDIQPHLKLELKKEISSLNNEYNNIITYIKQLQTSGAKSYNIDFGEIEKNINDIQIKLLQ